MSNNLTHTSQLVKGITDEQQAVAKAQIWEQRQLSSYDTQEYPIRTFIGLDASSSELFFNS